MSFQEAKLTLCPRIWSCKRGSRRHCHWHCVQWDHVKSTRKYLSVTPQVNHVNFQTLLTRGQVYYWHLTAAALRKCLKWTSWLSNIPWSQPSISFMSFSHKKQTSSLPKISCTSGCMVYKEGRHQSKRVHRFILRHAVKDEEDYRLSGI